MSRPQSAVAWAAWAAATAAALVFVLLLGTNVPYWDEWVMVPVVTGNQPLTLDALWSLHNEHRIPLSELVYVALFAPTRDFRAGMVFQVLALSAASALLIATARRLRGRGSWTDAVFPLLLLHPGHAENLIWSFQVTFVLPAVLLIASLSAAARLRPRPSPAQLLGVGVPALLAPLSSAPGLATALATGGLLLWLTLRPWPPPTSGAATDASAGATGRRRVLAATLGLASWALVALYMHGFHGNAAHPKPSGWWPVALGAGEVLTNGLGPAASLYAWWATPAVVLLIALSVAGTVAWWWRSPGQRVAAEGLLAMAAAGFGVVLMVSWGRSGYGPGVGFSGRYAVLSAPLVCWACLAWCRLPSSPLGRGLQVACAVASLLLYPGNLAAGRDLAEARRANLQAFARDVRGPEPLDVVLQRHLVTVYPYPGELRRFLSMLRAERLGPFSRADAVAAMHGRFPFVDAPLVAVHDGAEVTHEAVLRHRRGILVSAEGELVLDVRSGARRASGWFGVAPGFRSGGTSSPYDGTFFVVTFRPDDGRPVDLFRRELDPLRRPEDRALFPFDVALPGEAGELVLGIRSGPPGTASNDFGDRGLWADLRLR